MPPLTREKETPLARTVAKDHDQKRLHILKTAARVFADEGFARASMAQVAAACGVSKANIYHYYPGKDALLFDILDTYLSALRDTLLSINADGKSPEDRLHAFTKATLAAYHNMDAEHLIQAEGVPLLPEEQQTVLKNYQREVVRALNGILLEIAPQAFENDKSKLRATSMSVFGMLNAYAMWNKHADASKREGYADLVAELVINGSHVL